MPTRKPDRTDNQVTGNVGLYYVCYKLSLLGWNVMPTSRNAKGIDLMAYNADATKVRTVQVKTLSNRSDVPLGGKLDNLMGDFFIVCRLSRPNSPICFVLTPIEARELAVRDKKSTSGQLNYWLPVKSYDREHFAEKWERLLAL